MKQTHILIAALSGILVISGCKKGGDAAPEPKPDPAVKESVDAAAERAESAAGAVVDAAKQVQDAHAGDGHAHDEVDIGTATIGDMEVKLAQGHGKVTAGKESHLVVKLPYSDKGETIVRAWLGNADRTASMVGKAAYAPSHDDYDVHATAPDPLPENVMWWVEVEKPDGTKVVGSAKPLM